MASAKLAKTTVNQSHRAIWMPNKVPPAPLNASLTTNTVVKAAPTSTTNITGFFATFTGLSLRNDSPMARRMISGSNKGRARTPRDMSGVDCCSLISGLGGSIRGAVTVDILAPYPRLTLKQLAIQHLEMFHDGT